MPRVVLTRITLMVAAAVIPMSGQARADAAADSIPGTASTAPAAPGNAGSVTAPTPPPPAQREIRAVRLTSPISIDGELSEPVWQQAEPVETFTQRDPDENAPPTQ